jgi:hypothetical protein
VTEPGCDLGTVFLDLHPAAAAMAELATREVAIDVPRSEGESRREPLDHGR